MTRKDGPPTTTQSRGTASQKRNRATASIAEPAGWPTCLSDEDLVRLVRQLDGAVRAAAELPVLDHELVYAAALARIELRRRRARRRLTEVRRVLAESGWSP